MIAILKRRTTKEQKEHLISWLENMNLDVHVSDGEQVTVLGLVGDTSRIDMELLCSLDMVSSVKRVSEPFKQANRKFHPENSIISVGNTQVGGDIFTMIAGPCSVESEEQIIEVATAVKAAGATMLRGGAFKPRTSPYDFQGMRAEGIELLLQAKKETGLPIVTEIMNANHIPLFEEDDVIQVGARNMQNFDLLQELGKTNKPILLKRGLANTRLRDFYDIYNILNYEKENVDQATLMKAFSATCQKRETVFGKEDIREILLLISEDVHMKELWQQFNSNNFYVGDLKWETVIDYVSRIMKEILLQSN